MEIERRIFAICTDTNRITVDDETDCWNWNGARCPSGHPLVKVLRKLRLAHRVYYEFFYGPIPEKLHLHHECENPRCVNPDHLVPLTPGAHMRWHAKLNWDTVHEIRELAATGSVTQKQLGERFGVSERTIGVVVRNEAWRDSDRQRAMRPKRLRRRFAPVSAKRRGRPRTESGTPRLRSGVETRPDGHRLDSPRKARRGRVRERP